MTELSFRPNSPGSQPPLNSPGYRSTQTRYPLQAPVAIPGGQTVTEVTAPRFSAARYPVNDDLSRTGAHQAQGERIIVAGRVTDDAGRPQRGVMIEIWQANAAGRYNHPGDTHDAPLDPDFRGIGLVFTDPDGWYRFTTIKPGAYPWPNHRNAWRPTHIHYGLFGSGFVQRIVTQMYFPGDPLIPLDPVFNAIPDAAARNRLIARFDLDITEPDVALGYRFDMVLRGREQTPVEEGHHA